MRFFTFTLALAACLSPAPAAASGFICSGNVQRLGSGNSLTIDIGHGVWSICSLEISLGGIDPRSCAAWYALFTSAKMTQHPVALYFATTHPSNQGAVDCTTLGNWTERTPYFVELATSPSLKAELPPPLPSKVR